MSHAQRILVIYLRIIHDVPLEEIEKLSNVKYNTIRNILQGYRHYGRTNKLSASLQNRQDDIYDIAS